MQMRIKKNHQKLIIFFFLSILLTYYLWKPYQQPRIELSLMQCADPSFSKVLSRHASQNKTILLCQVDEAFAIMAINFYKTSLIPQKISNFLFLGSSFKTCQILGNYSIPCYNYTEDPNSKSASRFGNADFNRKMNMRTDVLLDALSCGFNVLHTDVDVHFFRNPFPQLNRDIQEVDIAALWDRSNYNAGFLMIKSTPYTQQVYKELKVASLTSTQSDQDDLNVIIPKLKKMYPFDFKVRRLSQKQFKCGYDYYEKEDRFVAKPCPTCIMVHNNWIVSIEAKVYRFKEHLMWMIDEDGYYSSSSAKYLLYTNSLMEIEKTTNKYIRLAQIDNLKTALILARILKRILILPRFICYRTQFFRRNYFECPLNSLLNISRFDASFNREYRENSFLENPLVPKDLRQTPSKNVILVTSKNAAFWPLYKVENNDEKVKYFDLTDKLTIYVSDIKETLGFFEERLLMVKSLYGLNLSLQDNETSSKVREGIHKGFQNSNYRQQHQSLLMSLDFTN